MKNLGEMTSKELKEMGKNLHISGWWKMKKEDLISTISSMTEEEKVKAREEKEKEDKLFEHYQKNWSKYGPKNDWVKFLEKYKKGKINLIEDSNDTLEIKPKSKQEIKPEVKLETKEEIKPEPKTEVRSKAKSKRSQKHPEKGAQIEYNGKFQNICAWARELGISPNTLYGRIYNMDWSIEKAFTTPPRKRG